MRRFQNSQYMEEVIFVDSTSSVDIEGHSVTFFLCLMAAGAMPVAVMITPDLTERSYSTGLQLLSSISCERFRQGPKELMTDDSTALRNSLRAVNDITKCIVNFLFENIVQFWPQAALRLCWFHVTQALWRWLTLTENEVPREHRQEVLLLAQKLHMCSTEEEAEETYQQVKIYIGTLHLPTTLIVSILRFYDFLQCVR